MKKKRRLNTRQIAILGGAAAAVVLILVLILALGPFSKGSRYEKKYESAEMSYLAGEYRAALEELEAAVQFRETEDSYLLMAECHVALGDTPRAVAVLQLAAQKFDSAEIDARLAQLRSAEDTPDEEDVGTVVIAGQEIRLDATIVSLTGKGLSDLTELTVLTQLESLTLTDNSVQDLTPLARLTGLTYLHLGDNDITDLSPLKSLTALRSLYLDGNGISDFTPLESMQSLTTLSLRNIQMTRPQIEALRSALPGCSVYCDDENAPEEITLGGVTFLSNVTELDLSGKGITDISALAKCTQLTKLDLRDNAIIDIDVLSGLTELSWLCLWNNQVEDLAPLIPLHKLSYIDLDGNAVSNLTPLSGLENLEELWLSRNTPKSIEPLSKLPKLRRLGLKGTGLSDASLDILAGISTLKELAIEDNDFSGQALDDLKATLSGCTITHSAPYYSFQAGTTTWKSTEATEISAPAAGLRALSGLEHFSGLESLVVSDNQLDDLSPLSDLTGLKTLDVSNATAQGGNRFADLSPLKNLTKLRKLNLSRTGVTDISALAGLTGLTELYLTAGSLSDISALSGMSQLRVLSLNSTGVQDISALAGLKSLTYLDLTGNKIRDLTPLYGLANLTDLYIADNDVTAEQVLALKVALPNCAVNTDLDLSQPPSATPDPIQ